MPYLKNITVVINKFFKQKTYDNITAMLKIIQHGDNVYQPETH
jgi:hypothetical protein